MLRSSSAAVLGVLPMHHRGHHFPCCGRLASLVIFQASDIRKVHTWLCLCSLPSMETSSGRSRCWVLCRPVWHLAHVCMLYCSLRLGGVFTVVLSSCEAINDALVKQSSNFAGRVMLPTTRVLSMEGQDLVFSDYNASWKLQRRLAHAALFNASKLRANSPVMMKEVAKLLASVDTAVDSDALFYPHAPLRLTSMNIIGSLVRSALHA